MSEAGSPLPARAGATSERGIVAGRVISGLVVLALAADAGGKLFAPEAMIAHSPPLGLPWVRVVGAG